MNQNFVIENLFPKPIYRSIVEIDDNTLLSFKNLNFDYDIEDDKDSIKITSDQQILELEKFKNIKNIIDSHALNFYHNILGYDESVTLYMCTSWGVKSSFGQNAKSHNHSNSIISGVLYLNTSEDSGGLTFFNGKPKDNNCQLNRSVFTLPIKEYTIWNSSATYQPRKGDLLLFPSSLFHKIERNNSQIARYSLAFNYFIRGSIKNSTANLHLK